MPYVTPARRRGYTDTSGELNYTISRVVHEWIMEHGICYDNLNAAIGVLECAKLELYRMVVAPYEDTKRAENGSVSALDYKEGP